MNIAICICTRNRTEDLPKALDSIRQSKIPPTQIIVSDDSDQVMANQNRLVCKEFSSITYIQGPRRGLSANRNCCIDHLQANIEAVSFIDDDVVINPNFLCDAVRAFIAAPLKIILTGRENKNGIDITPHNCSFWGHQEVPPRDEYDYHTIVINSTLFPRELFAQARFDEALRYGSEEADICAQAEALGYRVQFCRQLVNDHYPSPTNRDEYSRVIEVSRLYSTYKRYKWLERNQRKAMLYTALAPLHLTASILKARQFHHLPTVGSTLLAAFHFSLAEKERQRGFSRTAHSPRGVSCQP